MDPRRLRLLLELARLGSMREVAETIGSTTSTVSQQLAVLAREAGVPLIEPDGRRVRLTPAGARLAEHAVRILAAIEAARADLDPTSTPAGRVRIGAFASAVRQSVLPIVSPLAEAHPDVELLIAEHEPAEALALLASDDIDLALTYDYNLAPASFDASISATAMGKTSWGVGLPAGLTGVHGSAPAMVAALGDQDWIVNSRNSADDEVIRTLGSLADVRPRITHRADSLDLVEDMILAGLGVGLLPAGGPRPGRVQVRRLRGPDVQLRAWALCRRGRSEWPPLALVLRLLQEQSLP